jgi:hypothetical protein
VAAVLLGEYLEDGVAFAMPPRADYDAVFQTIPWSEVTPFRRAPTNSSAPAGSIPYSPELRNRGNPPAKLHALACGIQRPHGRVIAFVRS